MNTFGVCRSALLSMLLASVVLANDPAKPKVAVFPLGGTAETDAREQVAFSFRKKLDRQGTYEPIDGPTMNDIAAEKSINFATPPDDVKKLAADSGAVVLLWGELDGKQLKLHTLDLRSADAKPKNIESAIKEPTDLRFVVENILQTLPGIAPFEHPSEAGVQDDPASKALFETNPNLVQHGDFEGVDASDAWEALLRSDKYHPPVALQPPEADRIEIMKDPDGKGHVLAMNMSRDVAESNGLACISRSIPIEPNTRYRLQYRYQSDGPILHVFVKGYGAVEGEERELYRRQVPPSAGTGGKWVTVADDLNPQHGQFAVTSLKVDLYIYLKPGTAMFDDVVLKAVGKPSHIVKDDAVKTSPH